jgi:hypothetical protein
MSTENLSILPTSKLCTIKHSAIRNKLQTNGRVIPSNSLNY